MLKKYLFPLALLVGLFTPQSNMGYILQTLMPILLIIADKKLFQKPWLISIVIIFLFFISFLISYQDNNFPLKSIYRFIFLIILFYYFPFTNYHKINNSWLYLFFAVIFISQLAYAYQLTSLMTLFDNLFPTTDVKYTAEGVTGLDLSESDISITRFGGLFHNPNMCAQYLDILYVLFLININKINVKKIITIVLAIILSFIAITLTGSRTGMFVYVVVNVIVFRKMIKLNIVNIFGLVLIALVAGWYFYQPIQTRSFNLDEGLDNSFAYKLNAFFTYIAMVSLTDVLHLFFGYFSFELVPDIYPNINMFDSELGNYIFSFGIIGFIAILFFYRKIFITKNQNLILILTIVIWIFAGSILTSYRVSMLFMLILSNYYSQYLQEKNTVNPIHLQ